MTIDLGAEVLYDSGVVRMANSQDVLTPNGQLIYVMLSQLVRENPNWKIGQELAIER